jgi:hypothetical protein
VQVPDHMLKPNILVAVTRLRGQEAERGPSARDGDLFMERFMAKPKRKVQQGIVRNVEQTYISAMEMTDRALRRAIVHQGCASAHGLLEEDPDAHLPSHRLLHRGKPVTVQARTAKHGLMPKHAETSMNAVLVHHGLERVRRVFDWVFFATFHSARTPGCLYESSCSKGARAWASSFTLINSECLIPLFPEHNPLHGDMLVCYIRCFFELRPRELGTQNCSVAVADDQVLGALNASDARMGRRVLSNSSQWQGLYALVQVLQDQTVLRYCCDETMQSGMPDTSSVPGESSDLWVVLLHSLESGCIVLMPNNTHIVPKLRYFFFSGKYLHV